ncbi:MAG: DHH family phosphoesterase, partial [Chloroflexota bacterium]|nr:DHH family phosphoesterase [Chloroflexota bacterium]
MESSQWQVLPPAPDEYLIASGVPPLIAQLLYNRGIKPDEIDLFLAADHRLTGNPFLLPDMPQAVSRIYQALVSGEKIAVYGDFDVDGITATIVLTECLSWLGCKAIIYMPDRHEEGHGLHLEAIEKLHNQGVKLIITVDCGITACEQVERSQQLGMDIVITDHHIPSEELPQAIAVVDPKRMDSRYPFPDFAGVGVSFKLAQALLHKHSKEASLNELLELVALGTVTDLVPLVGENRHLVKEGLKALNNTHRI